MKIEELPQYIRKNARRVEYGIRIDFPLIFLITRKDEIDVQNAKKWLMDHEGEYNQDGYWFIPDVKKEHIPFPMPEDFPKIRIGDTEISPLDIKGTKFKKSRRVTKLSKYGR